MTSEQFRTEALTLLVRQSRLSEAIEELFDPKGAADLRVIHKMARFRDFKDRLTRATADAARDLFTEG